MFAVFDMLDAAFDKVCALSFDTLTPAESMALSVRGEPVLRRSPAAVMRSFTG